METVLLMINAPEGLHARPAALFCAKASKYTSILKVRNASTASHFVDAKSILFVLTLGVTSGQNVEVTAEGDDEKEAIAGLKELVEADFNI
jgi:phosphocarrier protein